MTLILLIRNLSLVYVSLFCMTGIHCKKSSEYAPIPVASISEFESRLEQLRSDLNIPGLSAGIVRDGQVIWTKGYGYANVERQVPVTNTTIFHLASLTKTFASTVLIQLINEGKIDLNAPVTNYGVNLPSQGTINVIHLFTHTSEGIPGSFYKYNGNRFSELSPIIQSATSRTFLQFALERIISPLGLINTAPGDMTLAAANGFDTARIMQNFAQGYQSNGIQKVVYPNSFSTAAGMISNMDDMLKYAAAYDGNALLSNEMKVKVFSPMISNSGETLPYGLGWFIQKIEGETLHWHYGYWIGNSSLIIRVPSKKLSFVLLANSDMLSAPYNKLGAGDVWSSDFAKEFLKSFVLKGAKL